MNNSNAISSISKGESLLAVKHQIEHNGFQRILKILRKSQSIFVKTLDRIFVAIEEEIQRAQSNIQYLKLLIDPCNEISIAESPADIPLKMCKIINIIRYIWLQSKYYNTTGLITKLYRYVGNQIIKLCCKKINVQGIFNDDVYDQIKNADLSIDCCLYYKIIYAKLSCNESDWKLSESLIFNHIDSFIQRLHDFIEICQGIITFGKKSKNEDDIELEFDGDRKHEFQATCKNIEEIFGNGLKRIENVSTSILDINDKDWLEEIRAFRSMTSRLDEILDNFILNVFTCVNHLEDGIYALACLHRFSARKKLEKIYQQKVDFVWKQFTEELSMTNDDLAEGEQLSYLPKTAGRAIHLKINYNRLAHLRSLLESQEWLPDSIETSKILSDYNKMTSKMQKTIQKLFDEWTQSHGVEIVTKLNRLLLKRSLTHNGLFECNIDHELFAIFDEVRYFKLLGFGFPVHISQFYAKEASIQLTYNAIVEMISSYNHILMSLSDVERSLLHPLIQVCDKCIAQGALKLIWASDGLDTYISDCNKTIRDLNDFIEIYQQTNVKIAESCERICDVMAIQISSDKTETQGLMDIEVCIRNYLDKQISIIHRECDNIRELILTIYEELESYIDNVSA